MRKHFLKRLFRDSQVEKRKWQTLVFLTATTAVTTLLTHLSGTSSGLSNIFTFAEHFNALSYDEHFFPRLSWVTMTVIDKNDWHGNKLLRNSMFLSDKCYISSILLIESTNLINAIKIFKGKFNHTFPNRFTPLEH